MSENLFFNYLHTDNSCIHSSAADRVSKDPYDIRAEDAASRQSGSVSKHAHYFEILPCSPTTPFPSLQFCTRGPTIRRPVQHGPCLVKYFAANSSWECALCVVTIQWTIHMDRRRRRKRTTKIICDSGRMAHMRPGVINASTGPFWETRDQGRFSTVKRSIREISSTGVCVP